MQKGRQWIWIAGNHDPDPAVGIGGVFCDHFAVGPIVFRHEPGGEGCGEIAGHLHPVARVGSRGRAVRARCFASDGTRLVMPAFGAYTGGLNVRDRAFANVFPTLSFTAHLIGRKRIYAVAGERCLME
jgi:metallophosphoesterase superfamily enzyme